MLHRHTLQRKITSTFHRASDADILTMISADRQAEDGPALVLVGLLQRQITLICLHPQLTGLDLQQNPSKCTFFDVAPLLLLHVATYCGLILFLQAAVNAFRVPAKSGGRRGC